METKRIKILLVEDEEDFRVLFTVYGELLNYDVIEAGNGRVALDLLATGIDVDVIALDLRMPEMSGFEFLRVYSGPVPVVLMTAYEKHHTEALAREPFDRVIKPINMKEAIITLRAAAASWRH